MKVELGWLKFEARKFTLGEYEDMIDVQAAFASAKSARERMRYMCGIVRVAALRDNPALTDEDMRSLEATPSELRLAVETIMRVNGFENLGEAQAAQDQDRAA